MADIRTLDLNLLKTLDALLDERNVTRAAARLALTQPSVSGMLARLREAFGDPLFIRGQRGMMPTARALELAGPVKRMLCEIDTLLQPPAFLPATASFTLSVAATDYAFGAVMVPFLAALRTQTPHVRVVVRPIDSEHLHDQLERGELDLALLTPDTTPPDLHSRTLYEESYVCALRADHPAAESGTLSLDQFCTLQHALVSYAGPAFEGATDAALARIGRERRVAVSVGSFLAIPELLRSSDLLAVVPRRLVQDADGLALRDPPVPVQGFTKSVVWHERTHHDPGKLWARDLMVHTSKLKEPSSPAIPAQARRSPCAPS